MHAMRWGLHVLIFKIIAHDLGCHVSIVWILFRNIFVCWCARSFIFQGASAAVHCNILNCLLWPYLYILLFNNACHEMESACCNFENYCSCSWLPEEHNMNNLPHFIFIFWCAPSFILQGTAAAVYCDILNCLLWPYFMYFAVWKCSPLDEVCVFHF